MVIASFRFPHFSAKDPCMCAKCDDCQARAKKVEQMLQPRQPKSAAAQPQRVAA